GGGGARRHGPPDAARPRDTARNLSPNAASNVRRAGPAALADERSQPGRQQGMTPRCTGASVGSVSGPTWAPTRSYRLPTGSGAEGMSIFRYRGGDASSS